MRTFVPRAEYGAALEPEGGVLHGAGQSADAFARYCNLMGPDRLPCITMTYTGARRKPESMDAYVQRFTSHLDCHAGLPLMPQIGLSMTHDGSPEKHYEFEVAAGTHDDTLKRLFDGYAALDRPFFLRTGYECNGPWNGYPPESYIEAFRHVTELLRAHGAPAATVWCVEPHEIEAVMDWYPGDDVVDWWSVDWFDPGHMAQSRGFLANAAAHGKPVMIGESSPRRLATTDPEERWNLWYAPYFRTIRETPGIKAFCYINWDWTQYPMWQDWGDARLEISDLLTERWTREMDCSLYLHGG